MLILPQVPEKMQTILQRPSRRQGLCVSPNAFFGWLEHLRGKLSSDSFPKPLPCSGIQVSRQALEQRLTPETAEMLKLTLEAAITETLEVAVARSRPLLEQFTGVYVQDSTWISLPDELHGTF